MNGLWLEESKLRLATDLPMPVPPAREALVRVTKAGICNTDLELVRGYYPYIGVIGHEFVGVVEHAPEGYENLSGRRVVGEINAVCGACATCTAGRPTHCENRTVLGIVNRAGAFAEFLTLPADNLHVVPETVPDDAAVFVEPLAATLQIQEQITVGPGDRVLVVGDGKLGQLVARTLQLTGCHLRSAGRHDAKLERLATLGVDTVRVDAEGANEQLHDFDVVVECTGNPGGFELARRAVRPRGTLVLKSTYADRLTLDASSLVVDEITMVGSRCGPFAAALDLLERKVVQVGDLIDMCYPLTEALAAFEHAARPGAMKVLVEAPAPPTPPQ